MAPPFLRAVFLHVLVPVGTLACLLSCGGGKPDTKHDTPPAVIHSFTATPSAVLSGDEVALMATFEKGLGTIYKDFNENGVLDKDEEVSGKLKDVTSGEKVVEKPLSSTHYILRVSNIQGASQFARAQVRVIEVPDMPVIDAPKEVEKGVSHKASTQALAGYTYEWNASNAKFGDLPGEAPGRSFIWFVPNGDGPVTLTCKARKGEAVSEAATLSVLLKVQADARKSITRFEIAKQVKATEIDHDTLRIRVVMPAGHDLSALTPTVEHDGVEVNPASQTQQDFSKPVPYTVKPKVGEPRTYMVTVVCADVVKDPVIHGFDANPASIAQGDEVELKAFFVNGEGVVEPKVGKIESGLSVIVFPEAMTTYTLTVSAPGAKADVRSVQVVVNTVVKAPEIFAPEMVAEKKSYSATVKALKGYTYQWAATGVKENTLKVDEKDSSQVTFEPDGRGNVVLSCVAINRKGLKSEPSTKTLTLDVPPDSRKEITGFSLPGQLAIKLDESASFIWVQMPAGTPLNSLKPEILHTGYAIRRVSGDAYDFTQPVEYVVEAKDKTTRTYKVQVLHKFVPMLTAKANPVDFGASTEITPQFGYGTGTVDGKAVESGKAFNSGVITEDKRFELKVETVFGPEPPVVLTLQCQKVSVKVTPVTVSLAPGARQTFAAEVKGTTNQTVAWSATGGTFENNVWIAPAALGTYTITAKAQDGSNAFGEATASVVEQLTGSLTGPKSVGFNGYPELIATFTPGAKGVVDQGVGEVKSGTPFKVGPIKESKTFTLTVTKAGAAPYTAPVCVLTPMTVSVGPIVPINPIVTVGEKVSFTTTVTGGATTNVEWSANAGDMGLAGVWVAPATPQTVSIKAASVDDPTKIQTSNATVVEKATAGLQVSNANPEYGDTVSLTPKWSGKGATLTGGGLNYDDPANNSGITSGPIIGTVTFELMAFNSANTPKRHEAKDSKTVTPQTVVVNPITAVDSAKNPIAPDAPIASEGTRIFSASVTGAKDKMVTWSVTAKDGGETGSISGGVWKAPKVTADRVFEIKATSLAQKEKAQVMTVQVVAPPAIHSFEIDAGTEFEHSIDLNANPSHPCNVVVKASFLGGKGRITRTAFGDVRFGEGKPVDYEIVSNVELVLDVVRPWSKLKSSIQAVSTFKFVVINALGIESEPKSISINVNQTGGVETLSRIVEVSTFESLSLSSMSACRISPRFHQSTPLSPLQPNRHLPSATLLQDGRVLVAGGRVGEKSINTAELYDPATDQFTYVGAMNEARHGHSATLLPDGRVLIVGGASAASLDSMEVYDPKTQTFTLLDQRLNSPRAFHGVNLLKNGQLLLSGGKDLEGLTGALTLLDTTSFKIRELTPMAPRQFHGSTLLPNGRVLFSGGLGVDGPLATVECLDPETGLLEAKESLPKPRYGHQVLIQDQKVLCVGGPLEAEAVDCFDLVKGQWQRLLQDAEVEAAIPQEMGLSLYLKGASTRNSRFKTLEIKP